MKRPKLWNILFIGTIWICLTIDVNCLRATSLIFAKTTTTTTTEAPSSNNSTDGESNAAELGDGVETETKPALTGIPQIDYVLDPNLPRELNGFNLTEYPFYSTVPPLEEINFTCDGLHDGFYASIPHKCQVYHHCLFGTRYDFLCANYTAFDQKTFICHFASEVDCPNSAKYFHRNDALYQAATTTTTTTTTIAPPVTQATVAPIPSGGGGRKPGYSAGGGHRRRRPPYRRRRPYDYYDEELEDYSDEYYDDEPVRSRVNRKKPMPRPNRRPELEYEEYEDEYDTRYDRRGSQDRRRPMNDRRRPYDDRRSQSDDRRRPDKRVEDDRQYPLNEEDRRKPIDNRRNKQPDDIDVEERRSFDDGRRRPAANDDYDRRPANNERRKPQRRPYDDDDSYDRKRPSDDGERRYRPLKEDSFEPEEPKVQIKPVSTSSIFSKPRAPPIIRRPVPVNERDKYDYTTKSNAPSAPAAKDDEYYDEYEDEPPVVTKPRASNRKPIDPPPRYGNGRTRPSTTKHPIDADDIYEDEYKPRGSSRRPVYRDDGDSPYRDEPKNRNKKRPLVSIDSDEDRPLHRRPINDEINPDDTLTSSKRRPIIDDEDDRSVLETTSRFRKPTRTTTTTKPRSTSTERKPEIYDDEYYDDEHSQVSPRRDENEKPRSKLIDESSAITEDRTTTTTRTETSTKREPYKIVRRPFLPSRGGNPLAARGLQPVGVRAQETTTTKKAEPSTTTTTTTSERYIEEPATPGKYNSNFKTRGRFTNPGIDNTPTTNNSKYEYITDTSSVEQTQDEDYPSSKDSNYKYNERPSESPSNIKINLRSNYNVGGGRNFGETGPSGNLNTPNKPNSEEIKSHNQNIKPSEIPYRDVELTSYEDVSKPVAKEHNRGGTHYSRPANAFPTHRVHMPEITTPKPKDNINAIKDPLDLIENEYDVTLNDALNPTIPNIPNRNSPSGFILPREHDYTFSNYNTRARFNYEPLNQASTFTYQIQDPINTNTRNVPQYQSPQFLPTYQQSTNYNTRPIRQQYTSNF